MTRFYRFARRVLLILAAFSGWRLEGRENIPMEKGKRLVIVANHSHTMDVVMLVCAFPFQICVLTKNEFSHLKLFSKIIKAMGFIFIKRGEPHLSALRRSIDLVKEGKPLGIFAEGTRYSGEGLTDFKQGAVFVAHKADAVLLPVAIINSKNYFRFWKRDIAVRVGKPIEIAKSSGPMGDILNKYTEAVKDGILELLDGGAGQGSSPLSE
ncbi:MAG: 1-acyl-sn-glycerol-3-phosphate acyltransferase [Clostridiales bacterium]|nr:1-acyl-sn-glycerol-3-phosphate acyltransferase [Clostridiales bacterium]